MPPNNPFKLAIVGAMALVALAVVVVAILGASRGAWVLLIIAVPVLVLLLISMRTTLRGRNPRWNRAPLDYWWARRRL